MTWSWWAPLALASEPSAEAERLVEEIRVAARRGQWAGVERWYEALVATGVAPPPESCQLAASAAEQRGDLAATLERLSCAPGTAENAARAQQIRAQNAPVALFTRRAGDELLADDLPMRPDAGAAVRAAKEGLAAEGYWAGLLPLGHYTLGGESLDLLRPTALVVARAGGGSGAGAPSTLPSVGSFGGRWMGVPLRARDVGAYLDVTDPPAGARWRVGGALQGAGVVMAALGSAALVVSSQLPRRWAQTPSGDVNSSPPGALAPLGVGLVGAGLTSAVVGVVERSLALPD